jgi:hypothetical protein
MLRYYRVQFLSIAVFGLLIPSGCGRTLHGAACPCVEGWKCCPVENVCVRADEQCSTSVDGGPDGGCGVATPDDWGDVCDKCGDFTACDGSCPVVGCLDQSFLAETNIFFLINDGSSWVGQTYTAGKTGDLVGVAVDVNAANTGHFLRISVCDASGGLPIATLGEVRLPSGVSSIGNIVNFQKPLPQTAGHEYAIVVNYPDAVSHSKEGTWYGSSLSDYAGGGSITSADGVTWSAVPSVAPDLHFATYVMPN